MSGLNRYLHVLRLFSEERSTWTIQEIAFSLDVPASTIYRTVKDLVDAEMLEPVAEACYRLGAAFFEFDRLIRRTDPLIRTGAGLLADAAAEARVPCIAVLARLYGDTVMCVADACSRERRIETSYERGRPRPLTRGATSKMILAQLPTRRLNKLLVRSQDGGDDAAIADFLELRKELTVARRCGYLITRGEVDAGLVGIAAPVFSAEQSIVASLSLVVPAAALNEIVEHRLVLLVTTSANLLMNRLAGRTPTDRIKQDIAGV